MRLLLLTLLTLLLLLGVELFVWVFWGDELLVATSFALSGESPASSRFDCGLFWSASSSIDERLL